MKYNYQKIKNLLNISLINYLKKSLKHCVIYQRDNMDKYFLCQQLNNNFKTLSRLSINFHYNMTNFNKVV
jgi:hypothetical protein